MNRYWKVTSKNNKTFSEKNGDKWENIDKDFSSLELVLGDKDLSILVNKNDKFECHQTKTGSANLFSGEIMIESRNLNLKIGNNTVNIKVLENNNNIIIEVL